MVSGSQNKHQKFPSAYILIKRQKDRTLKDELPRMAGAQYAIGDKWRNNSRKNEEKEPKQKQHLIVDRNGDGSQVQCSKKSKIA